MNDAFKSVAAASIAGALAFSPMLASAQDEVAGPKKKTDRDDSYTVLLSQDSFFGFYPSFNGLIPISDNVDFSFYGILWTRDAFGTTGTGDDLWTEFGGGVNIHALGGKLAIKPQIGITNGSLLSGGEIAPDGTQEGGNFADGVVPSLTVNYSGEKFEAEYYSGYYLAARGRDGDAALDFLHLWVNAGYKITNKVSAGAHYEWLENSRTTVPGADGSTTYEWVGPYVQFSLDNGFFSRFTSGAEVQNGATGDFYKLTAGFSF